jgi:hypothetical protein
MLSNLLSNGLTDTPKGQNRQCLQGAGWWRRGRVELPVQSTLSTNVYGCSHYGLILPAPTRWRLRAKPASLSWSFAWRP